MGISFAWKVQELQEPTRRSRRSLGGMGEERSLSAGRERGFVKSDTPSRLSGSAGG